MGENHDQHRRTSKQRVNHGQGTELESHKDGVEPQSTCAHGQEEAQEEEMTLFGANGWKSFGLQRNLSNVSQQKQHYELYFKKVINRKVH